MGRAVLAVICALLLLSASGCQPGTGPSRQAEDRLIGIFVTHAGQDEFLDTGRAYAVSIQYADEAGRERVRYLFGGAQGLAYIIHPVGVYYPASVSETIGDFDISFYGRPGRDDTPVSVEGTFYLTPRAGSKFLELRFSRVLQSPDGALYLSPDPIISGILPEIGMESGVHISDDYMAITLSLRVIPCPERVVILQMDAHAQIVSRTEHPPGTLPAELVPAPTTAFVIVEMHGRDEGGLGRNSTVSRSLFSREDFASLPHAFQTFYAPDGLGIEQITHINWR